VVYQIITIWVAHTRKFGDIAGIALLMSVASCHQGSVPQPTKPIETATLGAPIIPGDSSIPAGPTDAEPSVPGSTESETTHPAAPTDSKTAPTVPTYSQTTQPTTPTDSETTPTAPTGSETIPTVPTGSETNPIVPTESETTQPTAPTDSETTLPTDSETTQPTDSETTQPIIPLPSPEGEGPQRPGVDGTAPCVNAISPVFTGARSSQFHTLDQYDFNRMVNEKWGYGKVYGGISGFLGGELTLSFFKSNARTSLQTSTVLDFDYKAGHLHAQKYELSSLGKDLVQKKATAVNAAIRAGQDPKLDSKVREQEELILGSCGSRFVAQVGMGARIFLGLKFVFKNKEDAHRFKAQLKIWLFFFTITKTWEKSWSSTTPSFDMVISGEQLGGDSGALKAIIGDVPRCSFDKNKTMNGIPVLDDLRRCFGIYQGVVDYAKGPFRKQIQDASNSKIAGSNENPENGLTPLTFTSRRYDQVGLHSLQINPPTVAGDITNRMQSLEQRLLYWEGFQFSVEDRLTIYQPGEEDKKLLTAALKKVRALREGLDESLDACHRYSLWQEQGLLKDRCLKMDSLNLDKETVQEFKQNGVINLF